MKKRKQMIIGIALLTGIVMLTGAVFANYGSAAGYDDYKKGVINLLKSDNVTFEMNVQLSIDGKKYGHEEIIRHLDTHGDVKVNSINKSYSIFNDSANEHIQYLQDGKSYSSGRGDGYDYYCYTDAGSGKIISPESEKSFDKGTRFAELLADAFVGDLKNNIIMSSEDGVNHYSIKLDKSQVPEIVNAGLVFIVSTVNSGRGASISDDVSENTDPSVLLENDAYVKSVSCDVSIDALGQLLYNKINVVVAGADKKGNIHEITADFELKAYDYGTTIPKRLDVENYKIDNLDERNRESREKFEAEVAIKKAEIAISEADAIINEEDVILGEGTKAEAIFVD